MTKTPLVDLLVLPYQLFYERCYLQLLIQFLSSQKLMVFFVQELTVLMLLENLIKKNLKFGPNSSWGYFLCSFSF